MRHPDRTGGVRPLPADFRRSNRFATRRRRPEPPVGFLRQIPRPWIAPLNDEAGYRPMDPLPIVKPLLHQFDNVRHGFRRFFRIGLERKRPLAGFDDDHWTGNLSKRSLAKSEAAE